MANIHKIIEGNGKLDAHVTVFADNPPPATSGCIDYNQLLKEREAIYRQEQKKQE